jgi:hypothetical protein
MFGSLLTVMFPGHVSAAQAWVTVTVNMHDAPFPFVTPMICSWHVTVVVPSGKVEPDCGEQVITLQAPVVVGAG